MKPLTKIGLECDTDKAYYHLFTEFYNDPFSKFLDQSINILEIGILDGNSLTMLSKFFPLATIYAIDINDKSIKNYGDKIHTYQCNQIDFDRLNTLFKDIKFDIIIDDGSHVTSHQQKTLGYLFPYLKNSGLYVVEDLHTSLHKRFVDTKTTTLDLLTLYNTKRSIESDILKKHEVTYLNDNIASIDIYYKNKNALKCYHCKRLNMLNKDRCDCGTVMGIQQKSITSIIIHK